MPIVRAYVVGEEQLEEIEASTVRELKEKLRARVGSDVEFRILKKDGGELLDEYRFRDGEEIVIVPVLRGG